MSIRQVVFFGLATTSAWASNADIFNQRLRPILQSNCSSCHAQAGASGGLSFESFDTALTGGKHGPAIIPGDSKHSLVLQHVRGEKSPKMPMGGTLRDDTIASLAKVIDEMQPLPRSAKA